MEKSPVEIWLWLLLVLLPHNTRTAAILSEYNGSARLAATAMRDGTCKLTDAEKQRAERTRTKEVRALINECESLGIRIITLDDEEYPDKLREISDPPIVLFVRGNLLPLKSVPAVAIVGPRQPSEYGRRACDRLCSEMAKDKIAIVSGIAVGIDAAAHRCAINNNGYTIAVLACGLMVNYPSENEDLKKEILKSGGAIISELLPYAATTQGYFAIRNRIISGLCSSTLVIEASSRSGTLLTAAHTKKQNRLLMCIPPHDIFSEHFGGQAQLLSEGALPICNISDLYNSIASVDKSSARLVSLLQDKENQGLSVPSKKTAKQKSKSRSKENTVTTPLIDEKSEEALPKPSVDITQLSPEEAEVVTLLTEKALTTDELIEKTGWQTDKLCSVVLGLEINDIIIRSREGTFLLC